LAVSSKDKFNNGSVLNLWRPSDIVANDSKPAADLDLISALFLPTLLERLFVPFVLCRVGESGIQNEAAGQQK
jgi:hypothetical protein